MENIQPKESFLTPFFAFHFVPIFGIIIAIFVFGISSETQPLSSFIFNPTLYLISSLLATATRLLLWIAIDKGTLFEIKNIFWKIVLDIIVINVVLLSTLSFIFIIETFFLN